MLWWLKNPPPTIKSFGLCSLNKKGSPGRSALKSTLPLGCQKLTSSNEISEERYENQSLSVRPDKEAHERIVNNGADSMPVPGENDRCFWRRTNTSRARASVYLTK